MDYIRMPSVQQYVAISYTNVWIRSAIRKPDNRWKYKEFSLPEDLLLLHPTGQKLLLKDIYDAISYPPLP